VRDPDFTGLRTACLTIVFAGIWSLGARPKIDIIVRAALSLTHFEHGRLA